MDGSVKRSNQDAICWHQDANFMEPYMAHVISFLHTRVRPESGGDTQFLDLVEGWKWYQEHEPEMAEQFKKAVVQVGTTGIPDIKILKEQNLLKIEDTDHPMVSTNCYDNLETLFIGGLSHISKIKGTDFTINVDDVVNKIIEHTGMYSHHYEEGDMLIWDNISTMHRAANDYQGARLLYRSQARLKLGCFEAGAAASEAKGLDSEVLRGLKEYMLLNM